MNKHIQIFDTTLRDGEQSPGASMSVEQKVKMAMALRGKIRITEMLLEILTLTAINGIFRITIFVFLRKWRNWQTRQV